MAIQAINLWNTITSITAAFNIVDSTPYVPIETQLNQPLPDYLLRPGMTPELPTPAIPAKPGNLKTAINKLPDLFTLKHSGY